jgi:hypothetical protein
VTSLEVARVGWTPGAAPGIVGAHATPVVPGGDASPCRPSALGDPGAGPDVSNPPGAIRPIPIRIRRILQGGFTATSADKVIYGWRQRGRPRHLNPGGLVGEVIAYLWEDDPDEAMIFLAGYLAELNLHHPDAGTYGKVGLDELLQGLHLCLPPGFDQIDALTEKARQDVPGHDGSPV